MSAHATVKIEGADIPLIGVPESATMERCDSCMKLVHISGAHYCEWGFLCDDCWFEKVFRWEVE